MNDREFGCGLGFECAADESGPDAAAKVVGIDDRPVDIATVRSLVAWLEPTSA